MPRAAAEWQHMGLTGKASCCLAAGAAALATAAARGDVDVALVTEQRAALVGETVRVRVELTSTLAEPQPVSSVRVILNWNPAEMRLAGTDGAGAVAVMTSGFPPDPANLNESSLPQDGTGLFVVFAPLGSPIMVDQEGVLLRTLLFECVAAAHAPIDVAATGGLPATRTTVFHGTEPNLDITGALSGAVVPVFVEPTRLRVELDQDSGLSVGQTVTATVAMENLNGQAAAGFQAFLEFDEASLQFVSGAYAAAPFGSPLIDPIVASAGAVDLAAGIDVFGGQAATTEDAVLATLTFESLVVGCAGSIGFRSGGAAASGLSDEDGLAIVPIALAAPGAPDPAMCECSCELDGSFGIDVFDLLAYLDLWFVGDAAAELTGDAPANVDVFDLLAYLDCWFASPAGCG